MSLTNYTLRTKEEAEREYEVVLAIKNRIVKLLSLENVKIDWVVELGTGWSFKKARGVKVLNELNYNDINQGINIPSVDGHAGKIIFCRIGGRNVLFLCGRVHYYEGYAPYEIVRLTRACGLLNPKCFLFTNASGGMNPKINAGDIVVINDHIPGLPSPLIGVDTQFGPRNIGMGDAYNKRLAESLKNSTMIETGTCKFGVYMSVPGPEFETPAQVRMLSAFADIVGMSTTQSVTAIQQMNAGRDPHKQIKIGAISLVTNIAENGESNLSHDKVLKNAKSSAEKNFAVLLHAIRNFTLNTSSSRKKEEA
jgi:purine-nucleoside phosphorylase